MNVLQIQTFQLTVNSYKLLTILILVDRSLKCNIRVVVHINRLSDCHTPVEIKTLEM